MNKWLEQIDNSTYSENGALMDKSTTNPLLDMFAFGAAYRERTDEACVNLFQRAFEYDETYALRLLFYLRDILEGQGERRFFKVCLHWLAFERPELAYRNLKFIPELGRWDDLYCFVNTPVEEKMFCFLKHQFHQDLTFDHPSLLGKWLKSINSSSLETKRLGKLTAHYFGLSEKMYRKSLSLLREKIKIVEKLMSENRWEEIEFDRVPSLATLKYKEAFKRKEIISNKYKNFIEDDNAKVNMKAAYPYDIIHKINPFYYCVELIEDFEKKEYQKYWDNLTDYFKGKNFNGIAVVDTSGSMMGTPIEAAISLGLYTASKNKGIFKDKIITFASRPSFISVDQPNIVDKVKEIRKHCLIDNTNIEATFDLILNTAIESKCPQSDIPQNLIIISDMEFDCAIAAPIGEQLFSTLKKKWDKAGYKLPHLIFWNVNARHNLIPMIDNSVPISYVSGFSPSIFDILISGKTGMEVLTEILNKERYAGIY